MEARTFDYLTQIANKSRFSRQTRLVVLALLMPVVEEINSWKFLNMASFQIQLAGGTTQSALVNLNRNKKSLVDIHW